MISPDYSSVVMLSLVLQVEESLGRISRGEREFMISPDYSSVVMLSLVITG